MERAANRLEQGHFDLLVIGGGVYGAWTAYDAALRGLKVALVDKGDWASGTSSASSKLIHGGLRYLEHFHFGLVRKSLRERARLISLAPHRVRPWRFLIPLYTGNRVSPLRLKAGLRLYDLFSRKDAPGGQCLSLKREEAIEICPFLKEEGLLGALTYGDCITDDARFTLEVVEGAVAAGAIAVNYSEAEELLTDGYRVTGALVRDRLENYSIKVRASVVVDTSGPWAARITGSGPLSFKVRLTKGVHLVFPSLPTEDAFLFLTRRDKRVFFLVPWYGRTLVGTTDSDYTGRPNDVGIETKDVDYLLEQIDYRLRPGTWDANTILGMSAGLRTLADEPGRDPSSLSRGWILKEPREGLLVSIGGKFTTARADAAFIVDRVMKRLGKTVKGKPPTENRPFPFSPGANFQSWRSAAAREGMRIGLDEETALNCAQRYGTALNEIHRLIRKAPALAGRLKDNLPFCRAEVVHGAAREMAVHLEDLLRRRLPLMLISQPDRTVLEAAAALAAPVLGWDEGQRRKEIDSALAYWESPIRLRKKPS